MPDLFFTIFTPVYNRKHTIYRVWDSLNNQTYKNFEWIIINDGSQDGIESLLDSYKENADFPVHIFHQKNSGKHIAFNKAIEEAKGELLVPADSDDSFIPTSLEIFKNKWSKYKGDDISGISVLCVDEDDMIVGDKFPLEGISNYFEIIYKKKVNGEKWGCTRVDILKKYKFPILKGAKFFPESYIWSQIGLNYQTVYLNEPLRKYYQDAGNQLMKDTDLSIKALEVRSYFYIWFINNIIPKAGKIMGPKEYLKQFFSLWKYSILSKKSFNNTILEIKRPFHKLIMVLTFIPSILIFKVLEKNSSEIKSKS